MEEPSDRGCAKQRRVLGFALGALGLTSAAGESPYATRLVELEHTVAALLAENRRLRQELRELEAKLDPDAADPEI